MLLLLLLQCIPAIFSVESAEIKTLKDYQKDVCKTVVRNFNDGLLKDISTKIAINDTKAFLKKSYQQCLIFVKNETDIMETDFQTVGNLTISDKEPIKLRIAENLNKRFDDWISSTSSATLKKRQPWKGMKIKSKTEASVVPQNNVKLLPYDPQNPGVVQFEKVSLSENPPRKLSDDTQNMGSVKDDSKSSRTESEVLPSTGSKNFWKNIGRNKVFGGLAVLASIGVMIAFVFGAFSPTNGGRRETGS